MFDVPKEFFSVCRQAPIERGDLRMSHDKPCGGRTAEGGSHRKRAGVKRNFPT
jgi:hypothetical protein